ncbi:hypothetical protein H4Q26_016910 [Puccinia striiformis f. sp. tritici PST-130]|nr:hypothetical protein H4Q26_016910 [Puccinia striiformis f. sp. tritici PST-130]
MTILDSFTKDECKELATNWLWMHGHGTVSHSRYHNSGRSWAPLLKKINEQRGDREPFRSSTALKSASSHLRNLTLDFSAVYNKMKRMSLSLGKSSTDADLVAVAKEDYFYQHGKPFIYESAWYLFRDQPEWANSGTEETNQSNKTPQQPRTRGTQPENLATSTPKTKPSSRKRDHDKLDDNKLTNCPDDQDRHPTVKKKSAPDNENQLKSTSSRRKRDHDHLEEKQSTNCLNDEERQIIANKRINLAYQNQAKSSTSHAEVQFESQQPCGEATSVTKPEKLGSSTPKSKPYSRKRDHNNLPDDKKLPNCSDDEERQPIVKKRVILDREEQAKSSTTYDEVQIETLKINRLQLEVKRLEAKTEYERIQLDIMEKDLSSCTDEYEQEFFLFKKRKIIATLKSQEPNLNSTSTTKDLHPSDRPPTQIRNDSGAKPNHIV